MASTLMVVVEGTKAGMLDLQGNGATELGNACGGVGYFQIPNDGKTVVVIHAVTGDTWDFLPVLDKYGRTEALACAVLAGDIAVLGPWDPNLWNSVEGYVQFDPRAAGGVGNVGDLLLAMRISKPT